MWMWILGRLPSKLHPCGAVRRYGQGVRRRGCRKCCIHGQNCLKSKKKISRTAVLCWQIKQPFNVHYLFVRWYLSAAWTMAAKCQICHVISPLCDIMHELPNWSNRCWSHWWSIPKKKPKCVFIVFGQSFFFNCQLKSLARMLQTLTLKGIRGKLLWVRCTVWAAIEMFVE